MTKLEENVMLICDEYLSKISMVNNSSDILGLSQDSVTLKRLYKDLSPFFIIFKNMAVYKEKDKDYYKYELDLLKRELKKFKEYNPELVKEVEEKYGRTI